MFVAENNVTVHDV